MPITLKQQHATHSKSIEQSNIKRVLESIKKETEQFVDQQTRQDIKSAMLLKQSTTYELMLLNQKEYIAHQFTKLKGKQTRNQAINGLDIITNKFLLNHQLNTDKSSKIVIKNLSTQNVHDLNNELKQKLSQINSNLDTMKLSKHKRSLDRVSSLSKSYSLSERRDPFPQEETSQRIMALNKKRLQQNLSHILEFKEPGYWLKNQQKTRKIKEYLQHHHKEQKKRHKKYQQSVQKSWKKLQDEKQKQHQAKIQSQKQILKKGLQKTLHYKDMRQSTSQHHENQLQKIQQFLEKVNSNPQSKRLYQLIQEKYNQQLQKQRFQYEEKIAKIKEEHAPLDSEALEEHLQKYEQQKESLKEELQIKKEEFQQHVQQINEELRNLFHSKKYEKAASEISNSPYKRSMSEIVKRKSKRKQFALSVKQKFKPQISERKKEELEESIRLLMLSQDKTKKKVFKNGQIEYEEKEEIDGRKKGLQYLAFLRKYLENKPKKQDRPISTSVMQPSSSQVKKIDYLRENKPNTKFKASMIEWKRVIDDSTFKAKDKYTFLKQSISTLEHKAIEKQIEARNLKKSPQQLEKKDQFDKYYIESIEAKMAILNNLMLGGTKK